jgi:hypothetical protein
MRTIGFELAMVGAVAHNVQPDGLAEIDTSVRLAYCFAQGI